MSLYLVYSLSTVTYVLVLNRLGIPFVNKVSLVLNQGHAYAPVFCTFGAIGITLFQSLFKMLCFYQPVGLEVLGLNSRL